MPRPHAPIEVFSSPQNHRSALQIALDRARSRLIVSAVLFILGFIVIAFRLIDIMYLRGNGEAYLEDHLGSATLHLGRADVIDRNGELLATSISTSSLYANAQAILDPQDAARKLVKVMPGLKQQEVLKRLISGKRFIWIARHLSPNQKAQIIRLGIPGLDFMRDQRRVYLYGSLAAHAVGFVDVDGNGLAGIEKGLDEQLRKESSPLQLALDLRLQHILYDEIKQGIEEFSATGGNGIIMDVRTGEILAMVSFPTFDPNRPDTQNKDLLFNRNTLGVYEMGSTMKIVNTALALETGVAPPGLRFDATQPLKVGRFTVTDFHPKNSWLNVDEIFIYSSNIGAARMALKVGADRQKAFMEKLGFLQPLPVELPEIGLPLIPRLWREANVITISYGYGIAITPLHLTSAIAGIVNGGMRAPPTLLKKTVDINAMKRIVSPATSQKVHELMHFVVKEGTGKKGGVAGIYIGGKTGTTNHRKSVGRGYQKKDVRTSFIAVFPEKPMYIVLVMLERPKALKQTYGFNTAGWNAAPIASRVIRRMAPLVGLTPSLEEDTALKIQNTNAPH